MRYPHRAMQARKSTPSRKDSSPGLPTLRWAKRKLQCGPERAIRFTTEAVNEARDKDTVTADQHAYKKALAARFTTCPLAAMERHAETNRWVFIRTGLTDGMLTHYFTGCRLSIALRLRYELTTAALLCGPGSRFFTRGVKMRLPSKRSPLTH
jgi:hypothetical protein